jgi:hypothetical protein
MAIVDRKKETYQEQVGSSMRNFQEKGVRIHPTLKALVKKFCRQKLTTKSDDKI